MPAAQISWEDLVSATKAIENLIESQTIASVEGFSEV